MKNQDWLNDYSDFLTSDKLQVPDDLTRQVHLRIKQLLYPSALVVFFKIFSIHILTGFLSLAVCNQFGLNPFRTKHSLSDIFMDIGGHGFCMIACGTLFVSLSIFLAGFFLKIEEVKALRKTEFLQTLALGLFSLGLFMAVGAEVALTFGGLWLLGGLVGGFAATEIVWNLKKV